MTIRSHAVRISNALPPAQLALLRDNPRHALAAAGIQVVDVPQLSGDATSDRNGRWCDGLVLHDENTILVAPTPQSRRESFTILHEWAHMLVEQDEGAIDWLADHDDPDGDREALCDEIAGRLLIPDQELDDVIGAGPVRARHLQELHRRNPHASQMACAAGLARKLPCSGTVVLTDRQSNIVVFASTAGELNVRPRYKSPVPDIHPLRRITPDTPLTMSSFWAEPWGERRNYYLDATASARRTYSIMLVNDIWAITDFHPEEPEDVRPNRPTQRVRCASCGIDRDLAGWPCPTCGHPFCPSCGHCDCQRRDALQVRCRQCTLPVAAHDLTDGLCSFCA